MDLKLDYLGREASILLDNPAEVFRARSETAVDRRGQNFEEAEQQRFFTGIAPRVERYDDNVIVDSEFSLNEGKHRTFSFTVRPGDRYNNTAVIAAFGERPCDAECKSCSAKAVLIGVGQFLVSDEQFGGDILRLSRFWPYGFGCRLCDEKAFNSGPRTLNIFRL